MPLPMSSDARCFLSPPFSIFTHPFFFRGLSVHDFFFRAFPSRFSLSTPRPSLLKELIFEFLPSSLSHCRGDGSNAFSFCPQFRGPIFSPPFFSIRPDPHFQITPPDRYFFSMVQADSAQMLSPEGGPIFPFTCPMLPFQWCLFLLPRCRPGLHFFLFNLHRPRVQPPVTLPPRCLADCSISRGQPFFPYPPFSLTRSHAIAPPALATGVGTSKFS